MIFFRRLFSLLRLLTFLFLVVSLFRLRPTLNGRRSREEAEEEVQGQQEERQQEKLYKRSR